MHEDVEDYVDPLNIAAGRDHVEAVSNALATLGKAVREAIGASDQLRDESACPRAGARLLASARCFSRLDACDCCRRESRCSESQQRPDVSSNRAATYESHPSPIALARCRSREG